VVLSVVIFTGIKEKVGEIPLKTQFLDRKLG
jgi:hypothetical protein